MKKTIITLITLYSSLLIYTQSTPDILRLGDSLLWEENNYSEVIKTLKPLLNSSRIEHSTLINANINLGIAYYRLRDYENASVYYKKALVLVDSSDYRNKAIIYNQLGSLHKDLKEFQTSIKYFKKAYACHPFRQTHGNIANTYLELNQADSALYYHELSIKNESESNIFKRKVLFASDYRRIAPQESYKIILELEPQANSKVLDKYYLMLGRYYNSIKRPDIGKEIFFNGLKTTTDFFTEIDLLTELALYTQALKNTNDYLITAENYTTRLKIAEKQYVIFNKIIQSNLDDGDLELAFMNTERSKSIALQASLEITDEIKTVEQIQQNLRENELVLSYKILSDSILLVWEISPDHFTLNKKRIGNDFYYNLDEFLLTQSTFHKKITNKFNRFVASSYKTYQNLIGDIKTEGKDIIIVPEERFYNLSFDALITSLPDSTETNVLYRELNYMLYDNTFRYIYMASLNDNNTSYGKFSLLHIIPDGLTIRLAGSWRFHEMIKKKSTLLNELELKSKYDQVKDNYSIVHFDTHGTLNLDSSLYTFMEFGKERLYVKEIIDSKINNDIVVLSACNTGVGAVSKGEGGISFERAFILAGGKTIITSFWPGYDGSSPRIFPIFYEELEKGKRPEVAIREAKIQYFDLQKELDAQPFLWANYCVVGQSSYYTEFKAQKTRLYILSIIGLIAVVLLIVFKKSLFSFFGI